MAYQDYINCSREALLEKMAELLPEKRLTHCLGVERAAIELAQRFGVDTEKAGLAGLLHDYAKKLSDQEFLDLIDRYQLDPNLKNWGNNVWHGMVGIYKIQEDFTQKGRNITSLFIPKVKNRSWSISYTDAQGYLHSTYFNPYTMEELGAQDHSLDGFFETVLGLHRNLLLGSFGRQIVGGSVIIFVLLLFSGFVLWLPKRLKFLKESLTVKFSAKFQRINYDLHRTMGIYSMVFLLLIVPNL